MIPSKLNNELNEDSYYKKCCFYFDHSCFGKLERHHNLIIAGKQVQMKECILPLCQTVHDMARNTIIKEKLDLIMLERMTQDQRLSISKAINYEQRLKYLRNKYNS
jgi:hypothetical protein